MTIRDINDIIKAVCPNDEDYEKPCISPKYLRQELEQLALEQEQMMLEPTTKKDCNTCTHSNETDGSNCYECVKDMCNNYESTTKNDLGVDAVSRKAVLNQIFYSTDNNGDVVLGSALRERIARLPSVTPQLSSGLDKNSKKLEKDFGELDCISRAEVIDIVENTATEWLKGDVNFMYPSLIKKIKGLSSVTPQERKGQWLDTEFFKLKECSICHARWGIYSIEDFDFCPNCGCKMESEEGHG